MFKNVASKLIVYVFDSTTNLPKTGDSANLTAYVSKDFGTVTVLADTSATEMDSTNAKGYYLFDLAQGETNGDALLFSCKSSTANMVCLAMPAVVFTTGNNFSSLSVDSNGRVDVIKVNGTSQTARDIGASVLLSTGTGTGQLDFTSGIVKANVTQLLGTAWLTPGTAGTPDVNAKLHGGTSQTGRDIGASVLLSTGTGTGQLDFTSGIVKANATQWLGGTIPAVNVTGVPLVDCKYLLGTIFATPATAGVIDVNAKNINNVSTSSVTTVSANQGTTQPVNFTGTGASAYVKSDVIDVGGVVQTAGDIYAAVGGVAVTSAALNRVADSRTLTTGTEAGTYANTAILDGSYHAITAAGNAIDIYYEFDMSTLSGAAGTGVSWEGYVGGAVNTIKVFAYNWVNSAWDQIGLIQGVAGTPAGITSETDLEFDITNQHTGTAGNLGLVRVRFQNTGLTTGTLNTDRLLLGYVVVPTYQSGDAYAVVNNGTYGNAAIKGYVDDIGVAGAGLTNLGDTRIANLDAAVTTRMATFTLPTNFSALGIGASGHISNVDTLATYTGNTVQTADVAAVPTANQNADALLKRDWNSVSGEAVHSLLNAVRKLRNHWIISGSTLTVYKEDGTTSAYTQVVTATSGADPVTELN